MTPELRIAVGGRRAAPAGTARRAIALLPRAVGVAGHDAGIGMVTESSPWYGRYAVSCENAAMAKKKLLSFTDFLCVIISREAIYLIVAIKSFTSCPADTSNNIFCTTSMSTKNDPPSQSLTPYDIRSFPSTSEPMRSKPDEN